MSRNSSLVTCAVCGADAALVRRDAEVAIGSRKATVQETFVRCEHCETEYVTPSQMEETQRLAVEAIREREGLLQPEEIRAIRLKLGLTQERLETLLGVGPKTVVRWEGGTVFQNSATDTLLRVLDASVEAREWLAATRGVELIQPAAVTQLFERLQRAGTVAVSRRPVGACAEVEHPPQWNEYRRSFGFAASRLWQRDLDLAPGEGVTTEVLLELNA